MVKNKKMSKSSIAIIVLALLLVLSMVMGLTGAWFTDKATDSSEQITLHFGEVSYGLKVTTAVDRHGNHENGDYRLVAGTIIETGVEIKNVSNIDTYYVLAQNQGTAQSPDWKYYAVDGEHKALVQLNGALNATLNVLSKAERSEGVGANDAGVAKVSFHKFYRVNPDADGYNFDSVDMRTAHDDIFEQYVGSATTMAAVEADNGTGVWEATTAAQNAQIALGASGDAEELHYLDEAKLGLLLVTGAYEVRAIQKDNVLIADAWTRLTTGWAADHTPANNG